MRKTTIFMMIVVIVVMSIINTGEMVFAQYPEKPIRVIVAYSAGGGTDVSFRLLCKYAEKYVGVPLVVENRPGAGGEVGFTALAMAEPDGYTIGGINTTPVLGIPVEREAKFSLDSFEPILIVMDDPCVWAVKTDSPFQNLNDIVEEAKKQESPFITAGVSGLGGDDQLNILALERQAGVKFVLVPFSGGAPARAALLGGHVAFWGGNLGEAVLLHDAGELRILAVMARERHPFAPDIATAEEQGFPVYMESTRGLAAPKGIAKEKLDFLIDAFSKAMADPDFLAEAEKMKLPLGKEKGEEYLARLQQLDKMVRKIWEETPWK